MKFRLISKKGSGLPLADRLADEGFNVDVWVKEPVETELPIAQAWNISLAKDTIILFDFHGSGKIADTLTKNGFAVYGAGILNDSIEAGQFSQQLTHISGIKIPKMRTFNTFNEALEVFNEGELQLRPQAAGESHYTLSEQIDGPQMSVEQLYSYGSPVPKTLNSKLESGNTAAVRFWKKSTPKIYNLTLRRIEPFLKRFKYSGPLSCKVTIDSKEHIPYLITWLARFSSNGIGAFCDGLNRKIGELIIEMVMAKESKVKPDYNWYCSNGTSKCPDNETQARILDKLMQPLKKLQKWKYL